MKEGELLSRKWCEMLFAFYDKRNGAYALRAGTGYRYACALGAVFMLVLAFVVPALVLLWLQKPIASKAPVRTLNTIARLEGIKLKETQTQKKTVKSVESEEQSDNKKEENEVGKQDIDIAFKPNLELQDIHPVEESEDTISEKITERIVNPLLQTDGLIVDSIPHYPTGLRGFMRWLDVSVVYPPACVRRHIGGTVEVAFIVETDGSISDIRILKKADEMLNHEALRVMRTMSKWVPAKKNGKHIKAQVTIPIVFEIND